MRRDELCVMYSRHRQSALRNGTVLTFPAKRRLSGFRLPPDARPLNR
jgi:hypothetical protein